MDQHVQREKGFTLIELLVVIAIVAILAVVVILALNPAELLRQARDSNRISDLSTIRSALSLYIADVTSPDLDGSGNIGCGAHASSTMTGLCTAGGRFAGAGNWATTTAQTTAGSGWIPVNFTAISSGSPLAQEPIDPINNATNFYAYKPDNTAVTFELNADMESNKFKNGGTSDAESTDGGNSATLYEAGTDPGLDL